MSNAPPLIPHFSLKMWDFFDFEAPNLAPILFFVINNHTVYPKRVIVFQQQTKISLILIILLGPISY